MTGRRPARATPSLVVTMAGRRTTAARGLATWLARAAPSRVRGSLTIAFVSDGEMRGLNRRFRGVDATTDVLSFPEASPDVGVGPGRILGEIAIARGVMTRQARRAGHASTVETRILALHGLLHLLGYDHERDHGDMQRLEERLRRRAGLPEGLIARRPRGVPDA